MKSSVENGYWNSGYADMPLIYNQDDIEFRDLFDRYLSPGGSCFEVGCYPGNYLIYLSKRFGYQVNGIDTAPYVLTRLPGHLKSHGATIGNCYQGDFLSFKSNEFYDVVCSFGFVEHFLHFEEVIRKHAQLVRPGGTLIISCPNFKGIQYILHRLLDPINLRRHVLRAMNLRLWRHVLEQSGMEILHQDYYRTADFWVDTQHSEYLARRAIYSVKWATTQIDRRVNWPNPLLSPYMISFSRKIGTEAHENSSHR
jgi:SAM-dependent methyltransferase